MDCDYVIFKSMLKVKRVTSNLDYQLIESWGIPNGGTTTVLSGGY